MKRIAIIGGGIAGVTAAWQLARLAEAGMPVESTLFEASARLGGIIETVRADGFVIECGPDGWVTDKPWARELAEELGLADEVIASNDATRKTYVLQNNALVPMPDGMRMMVPASLAALDALDSSPLFSAAAKAAFRAEPVRAEELRASALAFDDPDESVASFVERHFGLEVLEKIGAPLLGGVFGGDVAKLSVRAVMAPFVAMERAHGSLILALEQRARELAGERVGESAQARTAVFTTLRGGVGTLIDAMVAQIPAGWVRLEAPVSSLRHEGPAWRVESSGGTEAFDHVLLAAPVDVARALLGPSNSAAADLMRIEASSAITIAFGVTAPIELPPGFGLLVPPGPSGDRLLAATFVDQKYPHRAPEGQRLLRAFFGGPTADRLVNSPDEAIAALALRELQSILGPIPAPDLTVVRRWPRALPQYAVGHLERMAALFVRIKSLGNLHLLGNGYRGVGLPDLIRDSRAAARDAAQSHPTA
jgi:oxygen-dependent protoporphyrinogen oxidase